MKYQFDEEVKTINHLPLGQRLLKDGFKLLNFKKEIHQESTKRTGSMSGFDLTEQELFDKFLYEYLAKQLQCDTIQQSIRTKNAEMIQDAFLDKTGSNIMRVIDNRQIRIKKETKRYGSFSFDKEEKIKEPEEIPTIEVDLSDIEEVKSVFCGTWDSHEVQGTNIMGVDIPVCPRCVVKIEDIENYTEDVIPDRVIEKVDKLRDWGVKDLRVAYPVLDYTTQKDPILLAYFDGKVFEIDYWE